MAHAHEIHAAHRGIGEWLRNMVESVREERAKRRIYRQTLNELQSLSARELADIGIDRSMIRRLALEAANGK